jgi:hypothetical protein
VISDFISLGYILQPGDKEKRPALQQFKGFFLGKNDPLL